MTATVPAGVVTARREIARLNVDRWLELIALHLDPPKAFSSTFDRIDDRRQVAIYLGEWDRAWQTAYGRWHTCTVDEMQAVVAKAVTLQPHARRAYLKEQLVDVFLA